MKAFEFKPKLFYTLKNYSRASFTADLMSGLIVGIVALPLAIAFGIASGVSPEKGIITAIVAGFFVSLFGGSRVFYWDCSTWEPSSNTSLTLSSWDSPAVLP